MIFRSRKQTPVIETRHLNLPPLELALEPRYVFDAALAAEIVDTAHDLSVAAPEEIEPASDERAASLIAAARQHDADRAAGGADADAGTGAQVGALIDAMVVAHNLAPRGSEIAFIDARLNDLPGLIGAIPEGVRIVLVESGRDGVAVMVDALATEKDITGIHIVSHGASGSLQLGTATLDSGSMGGQYRDALQSIGRHLSDEADILVYGCDFGDGDAGRQATALLGQLTGADVASSDDLTGAEALGGDWDLEVRQGAIEAGIVQAMSWHGVLDPFNISATTAPVVRDNTGAVVTAGTTTIGGVNATRHITDPTRMVGATAVWANAGFVGGTPIDLRATVISVVDTNPNPGHDPGLHFTISNGDDPSVRIDNAEVRIRWDAFQAGTYDPVTGTGVVATGDVGFFIRDIDALGHLYSAPGVMTYFNLSGIKPQESVRADFDELSNYQTESLAATHLTVGLNIDPDTGAAVTNPAHSSFGKITATNLVDTEFAGPESGIKFNWNAVSSWEVTYRVAPPPGPVNLDLVPTNGTTDATLAGTSHGQRFFDHDGDGDLTFASAHTVDMRHLDLDGDDSTAPGDDYQATFTEGGAAIPVVDADVDITGLDTRVVSARVVLTNPQPGDQLLVGGSSAPSGTVNGLAYTLSNAGGVIAVELSGSVTDPAIYEMALRQITFNNTSTAPGTTDRTIDVTFNNGTVDSNTAVSTIHVVSIPAAPVIDLDGPLPISDGTLPASPPDNAWQVALYGGHFGVAGSGDPAPEAPSGAPGTPVLHGVGYSPAGSVVFSDTNITSAENPRDSLVASGFSYAANPTNGDYVPGNGVWTMVMSRTLTEDATITVGAPGEYFDDHAELFVNGVRVDAIIGWYPSLPAGEVISYAAQAGDVVEIRLTNVGNLGGFSVSLNTAEQPNDLDHEVTFIEGDAPVAVTLVTKADAADLDDDITTLSIGVGGIADGASEVVRIGGASFGLDANATQVVTVGGTSFSVTYTTAGGFEISKAGGGAIPQADLDLLTRSITYENTSQSPTAGDRSLTFTATDLTSLASAPAVATITVVPVNDPPSGTDAMIATPEDTARPFTTADFGFSDPDGHGFQSVTVNPLIGSGALTFQGNPVTAATVIPAASIGQLVYTPASDANGTAVASFTFQVTDTGGTANGGQDIDASPNTITINVSPVNDPPVATDNSYTTAEDASLSGNVLAGDTGAGTDGDVDNGLVVTQFVVDGTLYAAGATATIVGVGDLTINNDGSFTFNPVANYSGAVPTATYTIAEVVNTLSGGSFDGLSSGVSRDTHNAQMPSGWIPGPSTPDTFNASTSFSGYSWSPSPDGGDFLHAIANDGASEGFSRTLTGLVPGQTYTVSFSQSSSNNGFSGSEGAQAFWRVGLGGTTQDSAPLTNPALGVAAGWQAQSLTFTATAATQTLSFLAVNATPGARVDLGVDGITVMGPSAASSQTASAELSIVVTPVNDDFIDADETVSVAEDGGPLMGSLLTGTSSADGPVTVTEIVVGGTTYAVTPGTPVVVALAEGTLSIASDGSYSFAPAPDYFGPVPPVTYTLSDGLGGTESSILDIAVTPVNDDFIDVDETVSVAEDGGLLTGSLLTGTSSADGPVTVTEIVVGGTTYAVTPGTPVVVALAEGTLSITSDGSYSFAPAPDYFGPVPPVTYTLSDGLGGTEVSTLNVTVTAVNDGPVARADTTSTAFGTPVTIDLLANDTDLEHDTLTVTAASVPANQGTITQANGVWTFTPAIGFTGAATITYTIADTSGATATSTHAVVVGLPPISARDDTVTASFNKSLKSTVAGNDTFQSGSTFSIVTPPAAGKLVMRPDGSFDYTPKRGFSGKVTFQYRIVDPYGQVVTATQTITVATRLHSCLVSFGRNR